MPKAFLVRKRPSGRSVWQDDKFSDTDIARAEEKLRPTADEDEVEIVPTGRADQVCSSPDLRANVGECVNFQKPGVVSPLLPSASLGMHHVEGSFTDSRICTRTTYTIGNLVRDEVLPPFVSNDAFLSTQSHPEMTKPVYVKPVKPTVLSLATSVVAVTTPSATLTDRLAVPSADQLFNCPTCSTSVRFPSSHAPNNDLTSSLVLNSGHVSQHVTKNGQSCSQLPSSGLLSNHVQNNGLPRSQVPNSGFSSNRIQFFPSDCLPFPRLPHPLTPGMHFPHPGRLPHHPIITLTSQFTRSVPKSAVLWSMAESVYHPTPVRFPQKQHGEFGAFGVASPAEVPSPPGHSLPDVPASPTFRLRSPRHERLCGFQRSSPYAIYSHDDRSSLQERSVSVFKGNKRNFKAFLESAKVRVETINDGNGLKNPLLSPGKTGLQIDPRTISMYTLEKFHSCPVCDLKCDTPKSLYRHVRSHREIKRYLCSFCGKGFNDTFDLKRHTRTHTGVRPYKCESCEKAFTQRCSLESHCRKIHGLALPFSFNERRAKIYVCESCGDSTSSLDSHFQHLRDMHPHHPSLFKHRDRRQFKPSKERSNGVFEGTSDDATEDESSDGNASRTGSEQERSLSHFRTTVLA